MRVVHKPRSLWRVASESSPNPSPVSHFSHIPLCASEISLHLGPHAIGIAGASSLPHECGCVVWLCGVVLYFRACAGVRAVVDEVPALLSGERLVSSA